MLHEPLYCTRLRCKTSASIVEKRGDTHKAASRSVPETSSIFLLLIICSRRQTVHWFNLLVSTRKAAAVAYVSYALSDTDRLTAEPHVAEDPVRAWTLWTNVTQAYCNWDPRSSGWVPRTTSSSTRCFLLIPPMMS